MLKEYLADQLPFWPELNDSEQEILCSCSVRKIFKKGESIKRSDECKGIILVLNGQMRAYILSEEGRDVTLFRLGKDEICVLSATCLLDSIAFDIFLEALEETDTITIPCISLYGVISKHPKAELFINKTANERFSDTMWTMQQILFYGTDRRIAAFLWDETVKNGSLILTYTHADIARLIGSAREVVTRMLKYFSREGIVALKRGKIEITDKERLKEFI